MSSLKILLCFLIGISGPCLNSAEYAGFVFTNALGKILPYRLLVPEKARGRKKFPLVLFLHGAGERGADNTNQLRHGTKTFLTPEALRKNPCFVLAPQCPANQKWVEVDWSALKNAQPATPSEPMELTLEIMQQLIATQPIDTNRIYITGLSMGGYGTWDFATRFPGRTAAAAPICGGGDEAAAPKAAKIPIWAFHSQDDPAVKVQRTRAMIQALEAAGGHPKYFEYSGLGHNSWDKAYSEPEFLPWLFSQRLGKADTYKLRTPSPQRP